MVESYGPMDVAWYGWNVEPLADDRSAQGRRHALSSLYGRSAARKGVRQHDDSSCLPWSESLDTRGFVYLQDKHTK